MDESCSDVTAIELSLADPREFGQIFERHWDAIYRFFERRLGPNSAEDLASDVFRVAFERRLDYQRSESQSCLPWLYGIASNMAMKERRRFARHLAATDRFSGHRTIADPDHTDEVSSALDADARWAQLRVALLALDDDDRELLLLVAWEDLTYAELADALAVPVGTVRSRLHRARRRLESAVEDPDDQPAESESPEAHR